MSAVAAEATGATPVRAFRVVREALTFLAGLALLGYEVLTTPDGAEPSLVVLGLAATMMGLAGGLGGEQLLNRGGSPPAPDTQDSSQPTTPGRRHAR